MYDDIAEFRKFGFHHVVLDWFVMFHQHCSGKNAIIPLAQIRDVNDKDEYFPRNVNMLLEKHLTKDIIEDATLNRHKDYIYALWLSGDLTFRPPRLVLRPFCCPCHRFFLVAALRATSELGSPLATAAFFPY